MKIFSDGIRKLLPAAVGALLLRCAREQLRLCEADKQAALLNALRARRLRPA